MKRNWILAAAMVGALTVAGCGGSSDSSSTGTGTATLYGITDSTVTTLGNYLGVEVEAVDTSVSDEDVQNEIDNLLQANQTTQTLDKTTVEDGDIVDIDFTGYLDGEAFDGGSAEGYTLEIGSGSFIDGFEDGLIGREVGEKVSLNLTFPENYGSSDLAGQDVVFDVTINGIVEYVTPEWNDEFVQSNSSYDNTADYEAAIREELQTSNETNAENTKRSNLIQTIIDSSEFDVADSDLQTLKDSLSENYSYYASLYGMETEDFIESYYGTTLDELALYQLQSVLTVNAITEDAGLSLSDEEYQSGLEELAEQYGYESTDEFVEAYGEENIQASLLYDKTIDYVMENAIEK